MNILRKKAARISEKKDQVVRLVEQKRVNVHETEAVVQFAAKYLGTAARSIFQNNSSEEQSYDHLMNACTDVVENHLENFRLEAKLKYYSSDKITELREEKGRRQAIKSQLEQKIFDMEKKKKGYESLGSEFKRIAKDYGSILREIEVENRIMSAFPSP